MKSRFKSASAVEGFGQLVAELWKSKQQIKSKGVNFFVQSGKRVVLLGPGTDSPRFVLLRQHGDYVLGYTAGIPYGDPAHDHRVEVVRAHDQQLYFQENGNLLSPAELAAKLLALVAVESESTRSPDGV